MGDKFMNFGRKNYTLATLFTAVLIAGCGPKTATHTNEFSGVNANVLNNNVMSHGLTGNVVLDAATAGDHVVVMFSVPAGTDIKLFERRMKIELVDSRGHQKTITGISDSYSTSDEEKIKFATGLFSSNYAYHTGYQYLMKKQDFVDVVNSKHAKFILEGQKGSTTFEYDYDDMKSLRDFANQYVK